MTETVTQKALRTDMSGMPLEWIGFQESIKLYCTEQVAYVCGALLHVAHGGINAVTGKRSVVEVNSIIATFGRNPHLRRDYVPPLNNQTLFRRDRFICMYCGEQFPSRQLSRDHVRPLSQGGSDAWHNVVTACRSCNSCKAGHTPEEAHLQLLAIPFAPTYAEYIYLQGRHILADQMDFLVAHFPRGSPLRNHRMN